jgi:hypothetical protein
MKRNRDKNKQTPGRVRGLVQVRQYYTRTMEHKNNMLI